MSNYNIMIIENDALQSGLLVEMISRFSCEETFDIETCASVRELETKLSKGYIPEIVFMDIVLTSENSDHAPNGIDLAERLLARYPGVQLVYVTGYIEYCVSVYRTDHVYLLTKPIAEKDLRDALDKALTKLAERLVRPFGVKVGGRIMRVLPDEIEYIESDRRKLRIYAGAEPIEAYEALGAIAKKLPSSFVQCHKSFLVNLAKVVEMRSDSIVLVSGEVIPVSQKRSKATREAFMGHLRERL